MKNHLVTIAVAVISVAVVLAFFYGGYFVRGLVDEGQQTTENEDQQNDQPSETLVVPDVSADDDPAQGSKDAPVTIIEFSDFQCPYSKKYHDEILPMIMSEYGDEIRYVYRDFPLTSMHSQAQKAAEAAQCAFEQGKFWEYYEQLFQNQGALDVPNLKNYATELGLDESAFNLCLDSGKYAQEVQKDFEDGYSYGVTGTPTFFINGRPLVGAQPFSTFQTVIEEELATASDR
jgi:protein-disulfide isomerase